jgi:hypothetical protein
MLSFFDALFQLSFYHEFFPVYSSLKLFPPFGAVSQSTFFIYYPSLPGSASLRWRPPLRSGHAPSPPGTAAFGRRNLIELVNFNVFVSCPE